MSKYQRINRWVYRLSRWLLAGVMILAGVPKLANPVAFAEIIGAYGLLPDFLLLPTAIILPVMELVAAFLLVKGENAGLWITALLMIVFIAVLTYGIWLGLDIDCGCFGPEDAEHKAFSGLRVALLRDLLLCVPMTYCFWHSYRLLPNLFGERP
ncbi:MauE/DoxX family redox-associated membrane protein [Desulfosediminicola ganghwensis]|uniref:MauE/DoxX family redox-associated membrane protein n=1 Tax=Desulfosediminicola ganghwensis TaxID=2569540 RepID=UPI0010AD0A25|nr:MauE/DoxX family redox-associated membrane protein [Desulfosediminicola ganghwensis]